MSRARRCRFSKGRVRTQARIWPTRVPINARSRWGETTPASHKRVATYAAMAIHGLQTLQLGPQFIRFHLAQVARLRDQLFMHLPTLGAAAGMPVGHRAFIETERRHNRLQRTARRQERDTCTARKCRYHERHRLFLRPQPVEGCRSSH